MLGAGVESELSARLAFHLMSVLVHDPEIGSVGDCNALGRGCGVGRGLGVDLGYHWVSDLVSD